MLIMPMYDLDSRYLCICVYVCICVCVCVWQMDVDSIGDGLMMIMMKSWLKDVSQIGKTF